MRFKIVHNVQINNPADFLGTTLGIDPVNIPRIHQSYSVFMENEDPVGGAPWIWLSNVPSLTEANDVLETFRNLKQPDIIVEEGMVLGL